MISQETPLLIVPLRREAHSIARQFATEQATPQKGKQVYLNTLAVYAVQSYLKWLKIETDLTQGDSWHSGLRALFNVADLVVPGVGRLECRPVMLGETACELPLEVTEDRIGYVAVQFSERLDEVQLLGFLRAVDISDASEQILIADLQALDTLLDCIPSNSEVQVSGTPDFKSGACADFVNLSRWLENTFEAGWQTLEDLVRTRAVNSAFGVRSTRLLREIDADNPTVGVNAGKLIDIGMQLAGQPVALIVKVVPKANEEVDICLRLCPTGTQRYLPPDLQLIVLDESGAIAIEAQARSNDNWIQLQFSGEPGDQFSVKVALGDVSITEDFVI